MNCEYGCGQEAHYQLKNGRWCCGKSHNSCPVNKEKNSKSKKGIKKNPLSNEHKDKIRKSMIGKNTEKHSVEERKRQSESHKGLVPWNKDKKTGPQSLEQRKKESEAKKGKPANNKGKPSEKKGKTFIEMYGLDRSKLIIEKLSDTTSKRIIDENTTTPKKYKYKRGWYQSEKTINGKIWYDSSFELCLFEYLDTKEEVIKYNRPKFSIKYFYNGIFRNYHPDVLVFSKKTDIPLIIETKPKYQIKDPQNLAKWNYTEKYCKENKMLFKVFTEEHLRDLENVSFWED